VPESSRRDRLKNDGITDPEMPPCAAGHLLDYLFEIGPTQPGGMGAAPLSHAELEAWQRNTGIVLNAWEARTLRSLSLDYIGETQRAAKPDCPTPWMDAPYAQSEASLVAQRMKASMKEISKL